jgi:hypothetical protein
MSNLLARLRGPAPSILAMRDAADEITRLQQALLDAQAGRQHAVDVADAAVERIKALENVLRGINTAWNDGTDVDVLIDCAAALLEKS